MYAVPPTARRLHDPPMRAHGLLAVDHTVLLK
jgi:hypothetical protein